MTTTPTASPIDVIEAAYDLKSEDRVWLRNLAAAVRPLLDGGRGVIAYRTDPERAPASWFDSAVLLDARDEDVALARQAVALVSDDFTESFHRPRPTALAMGSEVARLSGVDDPQFHLYMERLHDLGISDNATFTTIEPGGVCVSFVAAQHERRGFDARTKRLWARVSAHVAAARRLRAALAEPEAVLTPRGRLEHAESAAREPSACEALRAAVVRQDKARSRMRREDPEGATEAWTALVAGRWSLVEKFERGGRRYIVAHRNEHALPDPRALTARERAVVHLAALGKSNKLVAYELGVSESVVSTHLGAAMRKLGATSRVGLIGLLARPPTDASR